MALWDSLRQLFGLADRQAAMYQPSSMTFQDLDTDAIKESMRLEARGQRRGEAEEPSTSSTLSDEVEREITDFIVNEHKKSTDQYLSHARAFAMRLTQLNFERTVVEIKNAAEKVVADFKVRAGSGLDFLETLKTELQEAKRDLNHFQQEHNRKRSASTKSAIWIGISIFIMAILFAGETYFNGTMLGQGMLTGLSAGMAYAGGFSLINILLGGLVGEFGFRQINCERSSKALLGWLAIVAWLAIIVTFNLGVGHYRDALTGDDWEAARELAMQTMRSNAFVLVTLESYVLWGFGCLISLIAAIDIYKMDDPYPGYGKVTRQFKKTVQEFLNAKDDIQQDLEGWRDDAVKRMETSHERASNWRVIYGTTIASVSALEQAFVSHVSHLESAANRLLENYRGENVRARKTPAPARFSTPYKFDNRDIPPVAMPKRLDEAEVTRLIQEATEVLRSAVANLNAEYQNQLSRFVTITEVLSKGI
jgi:hypothetical protein